jgi:hypothetical protein
MSDEPRTGAEELLLATIEVEDLEKPGIQAKVEAAVRTLNGVQSASKVEGKLHVIYDPLSITEREIEAAIQGSGFHPLGGEAERDSPFVDFEDSNRAANPGET